MRVPRGEHWLGLSDATAWDYVPLDHQQRAESARQDLARRQGDRERWPIPLTPGWAAGVRAAPGADPAAARSGDDPVDHFDVTQSLRARTARARRLYRRGRGYRYPLCCVLRFAWDALPARDRPSGLYRGATFPRPDGETWVPCNVLHRADPEQLALARQRRREREAEGWAVTRRRWTATRG